MHIICLSVFNISETMFVVLGLACLVVVSQAKITQFKYNDCGSSDPNRAVKFLEITVAPMPIKVPGDVTVHVKVEVTKPIPKWSLKLDVNRHTFLTNVHVPCTHEIGSCTYDGCKIFADLAAGDPQQKDLGAQIDRMFKENNFDSSCPMKVQTLGVQTFKIKVPQMSRAADVLADGDYTVEAKALNSDTGELYGCIHFDASLERACTGWIGCRRKRNQ